MVFVCKDGKEFKNKAAAEDWENKILNGIIEDNHGSVLRGVRKMDSLISASKRPTGTRKERLDKGAKRPTYESRLPDKYRSYLKRANSKNLPFELSVEEFNNLTSSACVYCGSSNRIGVDRIDSSVGYIKGNVSPCCSHCNMMKYTYSIDFFLSHVRKIHNHTRGAI